MASCGGSKGGDGTSGGIDPSSSLILHLRLTAPVSTPDRVGNRGMGHPPDPLKDTLRRDFYSRMTPTWELDAEGVFLDLRGMERLHGPWAEAAASICQRARSEFPVWSAGLASSPLASRLASLVGGMGRGHKIFSVPRGAVSSFLAGFSIQVLSTHFREVPRLRSLGVRTLGDLQLLPKTLLFAVFGAVGHRLNEEAWGLHPDISAVLCSQPDQLLVAQIHFTKPLVSLEGEKALRQALAMRALSRGAGCGRWFLSVRWSSGARASVSHQSPTTESWSAWLALMEGLWAKLPSHRQGIVQLKLLFQGLEGDISQQMLLFENPAGSPDLSLAMAQIRQKVDPSFAPASEALLQEWGGCWENIPG